MAIHLWSLILFLLSFFTSEATSKICRKIGNSNRQTTDGSLSSK
jgi:hypothetical protein